MKKDKEWLKEQLTYLQEGVGESFNDYSKGLNAAYNTIGLLINELEEPDEIELSEPSAWKTIAKLYHPNEVYWGNVRDSYLESLDEPKKVVVNEVMAGHIENCKNLKLTLSDSLHLVVPGDKQKEVLFARAWLDGYTVDKEKVIIPQFVADFITEIKPNFNIRTVFTLKNNKHEQGQEWALDNPDVFARAWLDGYEVEKQPKYLVKVNDQGSWLYLKSMSLYKDVERRTDLNSNLGGWKEKAIKFSNKEQAESIAKFFGGEIEEITK